jgi:hypothetical protein
MILEQNYKPYKPSQSKSTEATEYSVINRTCPLYWETYNKYKSLRIVVERLREFRMFKCEHPNEVFGSKDYPMNRRLPLGVAVPGLLHAGITDNLSLFYTISGSSPIILKQYGIFSHDEAGIGQPANMNRQHSLAQKFSNQVFTE